MRTSARVSRHAARPLPPLCHVAPSARPRVNVRPAAGGVLPAQAGAVLLHLLMQSCTVNVPGQTPGEMLTQPAFYTHYATGPEGRRYGTVAWHESVLQMIGDSNIVRLAMQPRFLPMLVPARPWARVRIPREAAPGLIRFVAMDRWRGSWDAQPPPTPAPPAASRAQYDQGAYLQLEALVMRGGYTRAGPSNMQQEQLRRVQAEQDTGEPGMQAVFKALNVLGQTPWRVGTSVAVPALGPTQAAQCALVQQQ